jgi:hypothetical protein
MDGVAFLFSCEGTPMPIVQIRYTMPALNILLAQYNDITERSSHRYLCSLVFLSMYAIMLDTVMTPQYKKTRLNKCGVHMESGEHGFLWARFTKAFGRKNTPKLV